MLLYRSSSDYFGSWTLIAREWLLDSGQANHLYFLFLFSSAAISTFAPQNSTQATKQLNTSPLSRIIMARMSTSSTEPIQTNVPEVSPFLKLPGELRNLPPSPVRRGMLQSKVWVQQPTSGVRQPFWQLLHTSIVYPNNPTYKVYKRSLYLPQHPPATLPPLKFVKMEMLSLIALIFGLCRARP